jgi:alkaline phosphatase D
LEPGRRYWYGFQSGEESSAIATFKTLPASPDHLRFAVVSCAKYNAGFFNGYARIAERDDLDFVLHLGDYIYEASQKPPASQTPGADIGRPVRALSRVQDARRLPHPVRPVQSGSGHAGNAPRARAAAHA